MDGYNKNVLWGYKFNRGKYVFKNYVNEMYNGRIKSKFKLDTKILYKLFRSCYYFKLPLWPVLVWKYRK
jgi:hypothetical protein